MIAPIPLSGPEQLPHDDECERGERYFSPVTGRPIDRVTCDCRHRREQLSRRLKERPVTFSWLHGRSGAVPSP